MNPQFVLAYLNRGNLYLRKGEFLSAIQDYDKAIEMEPDSAVCLYNRGMAYEKTGQYQKAILDFERAIEEDSNFSRVYNDQAWLLSTCPNHRYRDGAMALKLAKKALDLDNSAYNLDTLAAAYAELGQFKDAVTVQRAALKMLEKEGDTKNMMEEFIERLNFYEQNRPWRTK